MISFELKDTTLHLYDIIASHIPSLDLILDHLPALIDFYFSPDKLIDATIAELYLFDNGRLLVHGNWPNVEPFMILPLSRC